MSDDEDKTLGDFFAKKDKGKKPKKKKKLKSNESADTQSEVASKTQVDEWKDFEEEKEKDYSNLKIQDLQVGDDNARPDEEETETNEDVEDGEEPLEKQEKSGIWNVPNNTVTQAARPPENDATAAPPNVVGGKYVPPALKRSQMQAATTATTRRRGAPPDITSQAMFPTLGAANQDLNKTPSDFEQVKRGTRTNDARMDDRRPNLSLGNRFDGLRS